jgi:hypothetical protein
MGCQLTIEPLGQPIEIEDGQTILDASLRAGNYLSVLHPLIVASVNVRNTS